MKNLLHYQKTMVLTLMLGLSLFQCQGMGKKDSKPPQKDIARIWQGISEGKTLKMLEKRESYQQDCKKFEKLNKNIIKHNPNVQLRCMTYNVHMWKGKNNENIVDAVVANVKTNNPDVVCLQEVIWNHHSKYYVTQKFAELGYTHGGESTFIAGKRHLGNVIFSKYQLTDCVRQCFKTPIRNEYRAFTGGTVMFDKTPVRIYCLHLDVWDETGNARREEIQEMVEHIEKCDSNIQNVIFMGDFNAVRKQDYQYEINGKKVWDLLVKDDQQRNITTPTFDVEEYLESVNYKDAYQLTNKKPIFTVWSGKIVDFVYFKPGGSLVCKDVNAYYSGASDHVPVIVDCVVDKQKTVLKSKL